MRLIRLSRSCASSPDSSVTDKLFLVLSNQLSLGLLLLLFPRHLHHRRPLSLAHIVLDIRKHQTITLESGVART